MLFIQDAFYNDGKQLVLQPELQHWQKILNRTRKSWVKHAPMLALQWYCWRQAWDEPISALMASKLTLAETQGVKQYWVVSPYHAKLQRTSIDVMPDHLLTWHAQDALWLVQLLNPLLKVYQIELVAVGACVLAKSLLVYDVLMPDYAHVSGAALPNRRPEGRDALRFMCMLSEIQALLAQSPAKHRQQTVIPDISGVWFWGAGENIASQRPWPAAISHDAALLSLLDEGEAIDIYTDVMHLASITQQPKQCILLTHEMSVLVERKMIPRFSKCPWQPRHIKNLHQFYQRLTC